MSTPELPRAYRKAAIFMRITETLGMLSTCDRKNVGALLVRDGRCISWGFNGAPPGLPHCSENLHGWMPAVGGWVSADTLEEFAERNRLDINDLYCKNVTHAEANAVAFAARQGISTEGCTLYVTLSPCDVCARLLIAAGIIEVVFDEAYRDDTGLQLLRKAGVHVVD